MDEEAEAGAVPQTDAAREAAESAYLALIAEDERHEAEELRKLAGKY